MWLQWKTAAEPSGTMHRNTYAVSTITLQLSAFNLNGPSELSVALGASCSNSGCMAIGRTSHTSAAGLDRAIGVQQRIPHGRKVQALLTCTAEAIQPITTSWQELQVLEMSMRFNSPAFDLPLRGLSKEFTSQLRITQSPSTLSTQQLVWKLHTMAKTGTVPSWEWMQETLLVIQNILSQPIHSNSMNNSVSSATSSPMLVASHAVRPMASAATVGHNHSMSALVSSAPSLLQQPVYQPLDASQLCIVLWSIVRLYQLQAQQATAWSQTKTATASNLRNRAGQATILQQEKQQHGSSVDNKQGPTSKRRAWHHTQEMKREAVRPWRKPSLTWLQTVSHAALQFMQPQTAQPCRHFNGTQKHESSPNGSIKSHTNTASGAAGYNHVLHETNTMQSNHLSSNMQCRVLATVSWALQSVSFRPEVTWLNTWSHVALNHMPAIPGHDLAQLLWAYGSWAYRPSQQWMQAAMARVQQLAVEQQLEPQDVAWILWACARLQYDPGGEFVMRVLHPDLITIDPLICAHAKQLRDEPTGTKQGQHNSTSRQQTDSMLSSTSDINQTAYELAWTYRAVDIAQLLWALSKLSRRPHERSMHLLLCSLTYQRHSTSEQDVTLVVWALAKLNFKPAKALISRLSKIIGLRLADKQLSPKHVPMLLWGLAKLSWTLPPTLTTALLSYVAGASKHLTREGSIMALYFAAKQQVPIEPWQLRCLMTTALDASTTPQTSDNTMRLGTSARHASASTSTNITNITHIELAGESSTDHKSAYRHKQQQEEVVPFSTASSAAALLWSVARLHDQAKKPSPTWMKSYLAATAQVLPHASGCDLWLMVQALAKLQHRPPRWWLRAAAQRMDQLQQAGRIQPDHKDKLATVVGKLLPSFKTTS